MENFIESFNDFLARPFSEEMDAFQWFAFIGLFLLFIGIWATILEKMTD